MRIINNFSNHRFNFEFIISHFGSCTTYKLKQWIDVNYKIVKLYARVYFLKQCKINNVIPQHLNRRLNNNVKFLHCISLQRFEKVNHTFCVKLVNLEIFDLYRSVHVHKRLLSSRSDLLANNLPIYIWNAVHGHHTLSFDRCFERLRTFSDKKVSWLINQSKVINIKKLSPIQYFYSHDKRNNNENSRFSIKKIPLKILEWRRLMLLFRLTSS